MKLFIIILLFIGHAGFAQAAHPSLDYVRCTELSQSNPQKAVDALKHVSSAAYPDSALVHCKAMALFNLARYAESAQLLDGLAQVFAKDRANLALDVRQQAARAWQAAQQPKNAEKQYWLALQLAIERNLTSEYEEILQQRAAWFSQLRRPDAVQDWDHLLSLKPRHVPYLLGRANALDRLGQRSAAVQDFSTVLTIDQYNPDARQAMGAATLPK